MTGQPIPRGFDMALFQKLAWGEDMTEQLTAGPDLDARVVRAAGYNICGVCRGSGQFRGGRCQQCRGHGGDRNRPLHPSTDLNDAFEAAEKAGIFKDGGAIQFDRDGAIHVTIGRPMAFFCEGFPDLRLAICAAILEAQRLKANPV